MIDLLSSSSLSNPRWLTIREVAEHFAVAPRTVRRWIQAGKLRAGRSGARVVRIHADDLCAFEASFLDTGEGRPSCPQESGCDRGLRRSRATPST